LTEEQLVALRVVLESIRLECLKSPLGNLLEAYLKVVALHALLAHGYTVMEGTSRSGRGKWVGLKEGRLAFEYVRRPSRAGSPDIRIVSPVQVVIELQARSEFGTQDTLFSNNVLDDLQRVQEGRADAFVLAMDSSIYDALRGIRKDPRGRKAAAPEVLAGSLPRPETMRTEFGQRAECTDNQRFNYLAAGVISAYGTNRIVAGLWRCA